LRLQWAVFYLALSVPALVLVEQGVLAFKFQHCLSQLDDGRTQAWLERAAAALATDLGVGLPQAALPERLRWLVLEVELPRRALGTDASFVLLELAERPFRLTLERRDAPLPADRPDQISRLWRAALGESGEELRLHLQVPSPWNAHRASFEWPIALACLLIFVLGSAWFLHWRVLLRVEKMAALARAWGRGEFERRIGDRGADELARLGKELDRMADDHAAVVAARAHLATLAERQRLARDLHDTVKQKVFALSLQLSAARQGMPDDAPARRRLADASGLVAAIHAELEALLGELRDEPDESTDLAAELRRRLADFGERSGIAVEADLPTSLYLPAPQALTVLKIVDEALANCWRHSKARRLRVKLHQQQGRVRLSLVDDGIGGACDQTGGMGIGNMRARAAELPGGELSIGDAEPTGTRILLSFDGAKR
jgi:signal transduction histidine kinase